MPVSVRPRRRSSLPVRVVVGGCLVGLAGPVAAAPAAERLIVEFAGPTSRSARADAVADARGRTVRALAAPNTRVVVAPDGAAADLARDPRVRSVERDVRLGRAAPAPDDPAFGALWGLANTGQTVWGSAGVAGQDSRVLDAWDRSQGAGVTVAVLDTGTDLANTDLAARLWSNPGEVAGNGTDDDGNGHVDDVRGWNFVAGGANVADDEGHGTHVAGTIASTAGNGIGIAGVAPLSAVMTVKVLDETGSGWTSDIADGFEYAAESGVRIVNASLGGGYSRYLEEAIARHPDVLLLAASGNDGADVDSSPQFPCALPLANVVCVAAHDNRGDLASFSNHGATQVDLAAPGVGIRSWVPGGTLENWQGTSMATPHVAGAAALAVGAVPGATVADLVAALRSSARPSAALSGTSVSGGALDAAALVAAVTPPEPDPDADPDPDPVLSPGPTPAPAPTPAAPAPAPAPAPSPAPVAQPAPTVPVPVATPDVPAPGAEPVADPDPAPSGRATVRIATASRRATTLRVGGRTSGRGRVEIRVCRRGSSRTCRTARLRLRSTRYATTVRLPVALRRAALSVRVTYVTTDGVRVAATRAVRAPRARR